MMVMSFVFFVLGLLSALRFRYCAFITCAVARLSWGIAFWATVSGTTLLVACNDAGNYKAEVSRTSFGVAHIKADNEKGLGYGVGYAYAQDNFCLLSEAIVTVNGERAKFFGASGNYNDGSGVIDNVPSDFYFKIQNEPSLVQASYNRQKQEVKDLITGYVAGVNRYLRDMGKANLPIACKDKPWVRNMAVSDVIRIMRRFAVAESGNNLIASFYAAQPPDSSSSAISPKASVALREWARDLKFGAKRLGSNGVALGKDATESGHGMLLANPHFPWAGAFRFYQLHLTIPGKVDVMGASLMGFPVVNIGHNRNVAWTHTVTSSSHSTLFALQLDAGDPTQYVVDSRTKAMMKRELSIEAADTAGSISTIKRTYYFTEYGPLVAQVGLDWTTTTAFAYSDANADNDRLFDAWWGLNKAASLPEFKNVIETTLGIPWVNTIATDKTGNAYYSGITVVPNVSAAKELDCVPPSFQSLVIFGMIVLDGSTSSCKWSDSPGTPQKGIFAASELPSLMRTDYVQNSNDSAWLTHPAQPLIGYPSIVSIDGQEQSGRTRIGVQYIQARLAGTDGQMGQRFTVEKLQSVVLSNKSFFATALLDDLKNVCMAATGDQMLDSACATLSNWDGTANLNSVGWPLFDVWRRNMIASGVDYWTVVFDPTDPINTPRGLRTNDPAVINAAFAALTAAVQSLAASGIDYNRPWGQIQVAMRGKHHIPIHGGDGDDIYNAIESTSIGGGLQDVVNGSSILLTVSFEGDTPKTQGFLTHSQSSNPASPYYYDQTERFGRKEWITFPFTDSAIQLDPAYSTRRLQE